MSDEKWHEQRVSVLLRKSDDLYKRIEAYAERNSCTVENVVDTLIIVGLYGLLEKRLSILESREE